MSKNAGMAMTTLVNRLVEKSGRRTKVDPEIPASFLLAEVVVRSTELVRGLVATRRPVFLGRGVRIRGKGRLRLANWVSIGSGTALDARSRNGIVMGRGSRLGRNETVTGLSRMSLLGAGLSMGDGSGLGDGFHVGTAGGVTIGDNVIAGPGLTIHSQSHLFASGATPIRDQGTTEAPVLIEDDCWIGSNVTILAGVTIASGSVVAAGSVVNRSFPPNAVLAGVPAKLVRADRAGE